MTRAEIKNRILRQINDNVDSSVFFTTAQLNSLVDEGLEVLAESTHAIKRTALFAQRPGTIYYSPASIADDIMFPVRIWNNTRQTRLTALSMQELDEYRLRWGLTTGDPEVWFPVSWDLFGLYPATSTSGGIMRMDYVAWPREMVDDNDEPEQVEASHQVAVLYGAYIGLLKKWDSENALQILKQLQSEHALSEARSGINKMSNQINISRPAQPHAPFPADFNSRF